MSEISFFPRTPVLDLTVILKDERTDFIKQKSLEFHFFNLKHTRTTPIST